MVDPRATQGKGIIIGPGAVVESNAENGDGTRIDSCTKIASRTHIGKKCMFSMGR